MKTTMTDHAPSIIEAKGQSSAETRENILALERVLLAMPQVELPIKHYFAPGLYLRQMTMPASAVVIGKIHKTEHLCILAQGRVTVVTEDGKKEYSAPAVIHSMPGTKRALYALDEVVWINCHHNPTEERDPEKIEDIFVTDTFEQYLSFTEQKKLEGDR